MENKKLFGLVCYLQRQMSRDNSGMFAEYGLTHVQVHLLVFIDKQSQQGERVCQKDVEKFFNSRASSVSSLLGTLEKKGFIRRTFADGDARTKYVTLTGKGKDVCRKSKQQFDRCDEVIQTALSEAEQEEFKNLLNKIIAHIEINEKEVKA